MLYVFQNIRTGDFYAFKTGALVPTGSVILGACRTEEEAKKMISIHQASQISYINKNSKQQ